MFRQWKFFPSINRNINFNLCFFTLQLLPYLKVIHFPSSKPSASIGAVRKQRFTSAGCCKMIILDSGHSRCFGSPGHQHTATGLLQKEI